LGAASSGIHQGSGFGQLRLPTLGHFERLFEGEILDGLRAGRIGFGGEQHIAD
jgi:hypothetical protein